MMCLQFIHSLAPLHLPRHDPLRKVFFDPTFYTLRIALLGYTRNAEKKVTLCILHSVFIWTFFDNNNSKSTQHENPALNRKQRIHKLCKIISLRCPKGKHVQEKRRERKNLKTQVKPLKSFPVFKLLHEGLLHNLLKGKSLLKSKTD